MNYDMASIIIFSSIVLLAIACIIIQRIYYSKKLKQELLKKEDKLFEVLAHLDKTQQQLIHSQKMKAIGTLSAGLAHEINTPIQYVSDNIKFISNAINDLYKLHQKIILFLKNDDLSIQQIQQELRTCMEDIDFDFLHEEMPKAIASSIEGTNHIANIIYSIKEYSNPGGNNKELVNVNKVIEKIVTLSRNEWKYVAEVKLQLDDSINETLLNLAELNQILLNLIINSSHAIEPTITNDNTRGTITISTKQKANKIIITISDTGTGIPDEMHCKIFDPFFTTKDPGKGTGQGLAIVYSNVTNVLKGRITFDSKIGHGTTFTLEIPTNVPEKDGISSKKDIPCSF